MDNPFTEKFLQNERDIACIFNRKKIINKIFDIKIKVLLKEINESGSIKNIAVILDRTDNLLVVLLASLIGGFTYIPIDPSLPVYRINQMLENGDVDLIITSSKYCDAYRNTFLILNIDDVFTSINSFTEELYLNENQSDIAYLIYTSGTTGVPKGVEITRDSLINFIEGVSKRIDFSRGKRILCSATVSFDIFFLETIMALYKGVTIVLANDEEYQNPKLLSKLIEENNVNMIQMTPSKMQLMLNYDKELKCLKNVGALMVGGEVFPTKLLKTIKAKTKARIYNMYGPTETTIWVTVSELTHKEEVDLGTPIQNTQLYIIDNEKNIITDDKIGEIAIAGNCLAKCYHADERLTNEKFIYLSTKTSNFLAYRTGDLGRFSGDRLLYMGRLDNQVKIRGNRIELEDIESVLNMNSAVQQAVVIDVAANNGKKVLIAYIIEKSKIDDEELCFFLKKFLPESMIPAKYIRVEKFEYTFNEKIDRKLLKEKYLGFATEVEPNCEIFDLKDEILNVIKSNVDQNIFGTVTFDMELSSSGIDSITFIKIVVALEESYNFEFDDEMLIFTSFPTIKSMIEYVESKIQ